MRKHAGVMCALALIVLLAPVSVLSQVLGACGTPSENATPQTKSEDTLKNSPVPLPGEQAINFELPAVVGDDIKNVKLSDYNGQWRVVCFYPADFTFV